MRAVVAGVGATVRHDPATAADSLTVTSAAIKDATLAAGTLTFTYDRGTKP